MSNTVFILEVDSGDELAPAFEILGAFSTRQAADSFADRHLAAYNVKYSASCYSKRRRGDYTVEELVIDEK